MAALLICAPMARAATYYTDASRTDDSGDGLSWATAKQTIRGGARRGHHGQRGLGPPRDLRDDLHSAQWRWRLRPGSWARRPCADARSTSAALTVINVAGSRARGDNRGRHDGDPGWIHRAGAQRGAGIYCKNLDASNSIVNCTISYNCTSRDEAGIYCTNASPVITDCDLANNGYYSWSPWGASAGGHGFYCNSGSPTGHRLRDQQWQEWRCCL